MMNVASRDHVRTDTGHPGHILMPLFSFGNIFYNFCLSPIRVFLILKCYIQLFTPELHSRNVFLPLLSKVKRNRSVLCDLVNNLMVFNTQSYLLYFITFALYL